MTNKILINFYQCTCYCQEEREYSMENLLAEIMTKMVVPLDTQTLIHC